MICGDCGDVFWLYSTVHCAIAIFLLRSNIFTFFFDVECIIVVIITIHVFVLD